MGNRTAKSPVLVTVSGARCKDCREPMAVIAPVTYRCENPECPNCLQVWKIVVFAEQIPTPASLGVPGVIYAG